MLMLAPVIVEKVLYVEEFQSPVQIGHRYQGHYNGQSPYQDYWESAIEKPNKGSSWYFDVHDEKSGNNDKHCRKDVQ
jgi:hypothetical protein